MFVDLKSTPWWFKMVNECDGKKEIKKDVVDTKKNKLKELEDQFQRLQAEFANYKKRTNLEFEELGLVTKANMIEKLLPIIDNFELALKHNCSDENYVLGMKMIHGLLIDMLSSEHVNIIDPLGQKFDPCFHEAIGTKNEDKDEDEILEVAQKGYVLYDKVIRRAKVIVNKNDVN
jgi:molecular chaperone GrpE